MKEKSILHIRYIHIKHKNMDTLVIIECGTDGPPIRDHIIMPANIARIYKKYIANNPKHAICFGRSSEINYHELKINIIADPKIIKSFKLLQEQRIETSTLNICELILCGMHSILEQGFGNKITKFTKHEQKIIRIVEKKDRYICYHRSILTKDDYEYIMIHKSIFTKKLDRTNFE